MNVKRAARIPVFIAVCLGATATVAHAALLVDFTPSSDDSVSFSGPDPLSYSLRDGPGFRGSGVGGTAGITLRSTVPASSVPAPVVGGFYVFNDVSLTLSGLTVSNPALTTFGVISQPLRNGTFTFTSSASTGSKVLLSGNINYDNANGFALLINGLRGSSSGGFIASSVTYTGGEIRQNLIALTGLANPGGDATFNALLVTPAFDTVARVDVASQFLLNPFTGRVQGQFSTPVIPEPQAWLAMLPALTLFGRRQRV